MAVQVFDGDGHDLERAERERAERRLRYKDALAWGKNYPVESIADACAIMRGEPIMGEAAVEQEVVGVRIRWDVAYAPSAVIDIMRTAIAACTSERQLYPNDDRFDVLRQCFEEELARHA